MSKLFEKKIEPRCAYCEFGNPLEPDGILCLKKGMVRPDSSCRAFRYDPLRRVPPKPASADFSKLKDEDFTV